MARFIEGYCDQQLPPPYAFQGVRAWSFPLLAEFEKIQNVVTKYLGDTANGLGGVSFDPLRGSGDANGLRSLVYMMVLDYKRMACINPPDCDAGYYTQKELLFGIPVIRRLQGQLPSIALFCPYIFVDNGGSMVCGNTVLGYPKQPAWFQVQPPGGNYPIRIDAPVMAGVGAETRQTWQRLVFVPPAGRMADDVSKIQNDMVSMAEDVAEAAMDAGEDLEPSWPFGPVEHLLGEGGPFSLPQEHLDLFRKRPEISYQILQLKQIRSAENPSEACYRSLLTCTSKLKTLRSFGLLPEVLIDLTAYPSLDIAGALGLLPGNGKVRPLFPYRMECDFEFVDAREQPF